MAINSNSIAVCYPYAGEIAILDHDGEFHARWDYYNLFHHKMAIRMRMPRLCKQDKEGILLLADEEWNKLFLLVADKE